RAIPTTDFPTPAQRPPFSVMDLSKLQDALSYRTPHWRDSLRRCLKTLGALKN
ncbi:MAG: sugar nucleotide-binding protein, partial [Phaeodactylibacter sp.]|nr:sugar nucleotide-binding protein [Phaeodactylibacter sp.]